MESGRAGFKIQYRKMCRFDSDLGNTYYSFGAADVELLHCPQSAKFDFQNKKLLMCDGWRWYQRDDVTNIAGLRHSAITSGSARSFDKRRNVPRSLGTKGFVIVNQRELVCIIAL
jgi:hypothetical protein